MNYEQEKHFSRFCYLSFEEIEKLPTPRLKAYFRRVREGQYIGENTFNNSISPEYLKYVEKLKQILDARPHVPRKPSKNEQNRIDFQKMLKKFNYEKIP